MILQIFGQITPPYTGSYNSSQVGPNFGLVVFLNNVLKLVFVVGGLIFFFNIVIAGFQFLNAGGDPKAIEQAWNKIWQSFVGLLIIAASFIITALISLLLFGNALTILVPQLSGPN